MSRSRKLGSVQLEGSTVTFYGDLKFTALVEWRQLAPMAKKVRDAAIQYRWVLNCNRGPASGRLASKDDQKQFLRQLSLHETEKGEPSGDGDQKQRHPQCNHGPQEYTQQ
ncbi:Hypothetical predicted protein [Pelobates cultripes]|uniref:Uncharacterized protein n=1 Tax=Pelobates cultripes TaxID=61616 RepID=A0AAD1SX57_PELCU|nr:Hypothetical predicted protein [Pelobates cultripes]